MNRQIAALQHQVIVCGYGRLGQDLAEQLKHRKLPFLAIDNSEENRALAEANDVLLVHGDATSVRVELDEFLVNGASSLAGRRLDQCDATSQHGLIIVGLKNGAGELLFNPPADTQVAGGDTLLVLGALNDILRFRVAFGL